MTSDASRVDEGKGKIGKGQLGSHLLGVPLAMQVGCLERGQPNETKRNPPLWLKLPAEETTRGRCASPGNCTLAPAVKAA